MLNDATLNDVRQEDSWNYEVGLKSSWLDNRLNISLAAFINKVGDYQVILPNAQGFSLISPTPKLELLALKQKLEQFP